jgi:hypothetical protein
LKLLSGWPAITWWFPSKQGSSPATTPNLGWDTLFAGSGLAGSSSVTSTTGRRVVTSGSALLLLLLLRDVSGMAVLKLLKA